MPAMQPLPRCTAAVAFVLACALALAQADGTAGTSPSGGSVDGASQSPYPVVNFGSTEHSYALVGLGLLLALAALLVAAVLSLVTVAAASGMSVPLLAALPTSSAALLAVQLLGKMGQDAEAPGCLVDLGRSLVWAAPPTPDAELMVALSVLCAIWLCRWLRARRHDLEAGAHLPHNLVPGAWELRATGLLAFSLSSASTGVLLGRTQRPLTGPVVAFCVLYFLLHHVLLSMKFVSEALADGLVVRTALPATAGGAEVFVDRTCDQLRALPIAPPTPGCLALYGCWPPSPAWYTAPAVAAVHEVENRGPQVQDVEMDGGMEWSSVSPWCSADGAGKAKETAGELEDELQGRPLLVQDHEHEETAVGPGSPEAGSPGGHSPEHRAGSPRAGRGAGCAQGAAREPPVPELTLPSAVNLAHPVRVTVAEAYEVKAHDLIAGVTCIPWLDCAVPAGALQRIEELGGHTMLQAHPGQLSGSLASGRFAVCFDWGTRWPWRWSAEVAVKAILGIWAAMPLNGGAGLGPLSAIAHFLMLAVAGFFTYGVLMVGPYDHRNDDAALATSSLTSVLVVLLRAFWSGRPSSGLGSALAAVAGAVALVPCALALLVAVGLASSTLSRLEAQGLQDRCLQRVVPGWGCPGHGARGGGSCDAGARSPAGDAMGASCGLLPQTAEGGSDGHAIDVVMPGRRKAFTILLPGLARPQVMHAQLLPPVVGRNGDPDSLPPCAATGDRARLPVPASLLFPVAAPPDSRGPAFGGEADATVLQQRRSVPPLVALLAPGHTGRVIYAQAENNEARQEWHEAIHGFFGLDGSLLAEEAQRLVQQHAEPDGGQATGRVLMIIEVLPAWAAEFLDERHDPSNGS